ncbi:UvrB/UvrC motif-containing protein [bacterium]|nr:UvrB/UvrC motif-containing protein [bacterium]
MICDECGRPATIRFVETVNGEMRLMRLCGECAAARGIGLSFAPLAGPLVNMLMGFLEEVGAQDSVEVPEPACSECGLPYDEFRRTGKLGCAVCYTSFEKELRPLIRRINGSTRHTGRIPTSAPDDVESIREVRRLKVDLERAVRGEEYERAAELRDRIRDLESKRSEGGDDGDV